MIETIVLAIIAVAPAFVAVISIIVACLSLAHKFTALKKEVINTKEYQDVKAQLAIAHRENVELKKLIKQLLTKIDHVQRPEEE